MITTFLLMAIGGALVAFSAVVPSFSSSISPLISAARSLGSQVGGAIPYGSVVPWNLVRICLGALLAVWAFGATTRVTVMVFAWIRSRGTASE